MSKYGQPEHVSYIPETNSVQEFPDDPVTQDQDAQEATAKAREAGTIRRRPAN